MIFEFAYAYLLGLLSILSPCTFIIVPVMTADVQSKMKHIFGFLGGITVTFGSLGILSAITGKLLTNFVGPYLYLFAGAVTLVAALHMLGVLKMKFPTMFSTTKTKSSFLKGLLYGGVAMSCVGPLMASILVYITAKASITFGFLMMYTFSLGFITPFLLGGFLIKDKRIAEKLMKYPLQKIGGIMLLLVSGYLLFVAVRGML